MGFVVEFVHKDDEVKKSTQLNKLRISFLSSSLHYITSLEVFTRGNHCIEVLRTWIFCVILVLTPLMHYSYYSFYGFEVHQITANAAELLLPSIQLINVLQLLQHILSR